MDVVHKNNKESFLEKNEEASAVLYKVLKKLPKPLASMKLNAAQKKWWSWFGVEFISTKQLSTVDLLHLQEAAFWMDVRCQAIKKVNDLGYSGLVQTFASKATNITGHVSVIEKADKHLDNVSAHFGLSFKDRNKMKSPEVSNANQMSLFDEVLKKLHG
tara:strand:+ start:60 stop:536 length:477 start_codon:yes stop_codon:yes gene_type:complete